MTYAEQAPAEVLRRDVLCTYRHDVPGDTPPGEHRILANAFIDIVWVRGSEPLVTGPDTGPRTIPMLASMQFLGVRFKPGHAPAALGVAAAELTDRRVWLSDVWGQYGALVAEEMHDAPSDDAAWEVLTRALAQRVAGAIAPDPIVDAAVAALGRARLSSVGDLAASLNISDRQLLRRFTAGVGFGPKRFHRISRMRRFLALSGCRLPVDRSLDALAVEAGYSDQAHLTHDFTALAGVTPVAHFTDPGSWA